MGGGEFFRVALKKMGEGGLTIFFGFKVEKRGWGDGGTEGGGGGRTNERPGTDHVT